MEVYIKIFWWFLGIAGMIGSSLVIAAALSVIKASREVPLLAVKISNIQDNLKEHREDVSKTNDKIIDVFLSEVDPIKKDVKDLQDKQQMHSEKIVRIQTHLKLN